MTTRKTFGHYQVVEELGRGGMGVVYKAWEPSLDRFVAIKVLADNLAHNESLKVRFAREAKAMATINHPNVIHIHYIGEEKGLPYFAMEFIDGKSLSELLKKGNIISLPHARNIIYQACKGLLAAHKKGLIHRDIKPDNLMITDEGLLKVVDFGIALSYKSDEKLTNTGEMVGTPGYVSPEACIGKTIDKRADIFSLGIVFYEILAGKVPFENDSPLGLMLEVVQAEILDIREINKKIDKNTSKVLKKMVMKSPSERYQNCAQIMNDLGRIDQNKTIKTILSDSIVVDLQQIKKNISSDHTIIDSLPETGLNLEKSVPIHKNIPFVVLVLFIVLSSLGWYFINSDSRANHIPKDRKVKEKLFVKQETINQPKKEHVDSSNDNIEQPKQVQKTVVGVPMPVQQKQNKKTSGIEKSIKKSESKTPIRKAPNTELANKIKNKKVLVVAKQKTKKAETNAGGDNINPKKKIVLNKQDKVAANEGPNKVVNNSIATIAEQKTPVMIETTSLDNNGKYNCIEINEFEVDRTNHKSKALERAAKIPEEILNQIQFITIGEIIRGGYGLQAVEPKKNICPNNSSSLILSGLVTDYKKGNKVVRYMVGFGAGKQKFQVELILKEKQSQKVLAKKRVVDRKIGGLIGGSDEKGKYDFAEKISLFIKAAI